MVDGIIFYCDRIPVITTTKKGTIRSKVVVQQARATYSSHAIRHVSFHGPTDSMGYWRNRKRASLARTRYWDRNPDTPLRYGVVGNISACHADAQGSIPCFGDFFLRLLLFIFLNFYGPVDCTGYWRNRKRASFARTRYWDRNPDAPLRYGVVGNISACHADAQGSIPRFGDFFFFY